MLLRFALPLLPALLAFLGFLAGVFFVAVFFAVLAFVVFLAAFRCFSFFSSRVMAIVYLRVFFLLFSLTNPSKLRQVLLHELGHQLGAAGHVPRNGRGLGPILCGWAGCMDPALTDYQPEDVSYICMAGRGGRCRGL